jgi:hypothetical protein
VDNNPKKGNDVLAITNDFERTKFIICEYKEYANIPSQKISEKEFINFWNAKIAEIKKENI